MINKTQLETELLRWNDFIKLNSQQPKAYIQRGMVNFKLARIGESIADFDQAERLDPTLTPYLWQRGLSYYYNDQYEAGAKQFELDLQVNYQDLEETLWRYLCIARFLGINEAEKCLVFGKSDSRKILNKIAEFYQNQSSPEELLNHGKKEGTRGQFYSHLYLGLYYEVRGNLSEAREYIVKAVNQYPLNDYMWYLANVHQQLRQW